MLSIDALEIFYIFGKYIFTLVVFLGTSVAMHEGGHILFAKYHRLDYKLLYQKGNISVIADWKKTGNKKVYGNFLGILLGLPPIIAGGWLYSTPLFLALYLISCYDDFSDIARFYIGHKKIF